MTLEVFEKSYSSPVLCCDVFASFFFLISTTDMEEFLPNWERVVKIFVEKAIIELQWATPSSIHLLVPLSLIFFAWAELSTFKRQQRFFIAENNCFLWIVQARERRRCNNVWMFIAFKLMRAHFHIKFEISQSHKKCIRFSIKLQTLENVRRDRIIQAKGCPHFSIGPLHILTC